MVKASEKKREIFDFFKNNSDKIFENAKLVESTKELVTLFCKVIRGYRLYPRTNPAFSVFADQFKEKLDEILRDIPSISLRISTKGFMIGRNVLDSGERNKEIVFFLYNDGLREIFFQKGTEKEEISKLFNVLAQCALFANEDYDLSTLLWDYNFTNIGYITEDELIKSNLIISSDRENPFSPFSEKELSDSIEIQNAEINLDGGTDEATQTNLSERKSLLDRKLLRYVVGKMEMLKFDETLKKNSDAFVVNRFLRELASRLMNNVGNEAGKELLNTAASLWEKLLLFGSITGSILFIKTLKAISEKLAETRPEYSKKIRESLKSLEDEDFLNDWLSTLEDVPQRELEASGELLAMISPKKLEFLINKINDIESKETRIAVINSFSKFISVSDELIELTKNSDWKIVRNALVLMKEKQDPRIVPAIRQILAHPQKQTGIEALALLMDFSLEEALPALEKAVFSTSRDVRSPAIKKILELKNNSVKPIVNRLFLIHNLKKLESDEIDETLRLIVDMRRYDLFDLLGSLILAEDQSIRQKAMAAIKTGSSLEHFAKFIARACNVSFISKMKNDELKLFCSLFKPEIFDNLLPALEPLLFVSSGLFNKTIFNIKESVLRTLFTYRSSPKIQNFINKALTSKNKETIKITNKIKDKYL